MSSRRKNYRKSLTLFWEPLGANGKDCVGPAPAGGVFTGVSPWWGRGERASLHNDGYVKPTPAGSRRVEAKGGGVKGKV
jgi:hypothetical protein